MPNTSYKTVFINLKHIPFVITHTARSWSHLLSDLGSRQCMKFTSPQECIENSLSFDQHQNFTSPDTIIHQTEPPVVYVHIQFHAVIML